MSAELMQNPGKSRLPPGLPGPGSLDPVASETLPFAAAWSTALSSAFARAAELTTNRTELIGLAVLLLLASGAGVVGVGVGVVDVGV